MKQEIINHIEKLEKEKAIQILLAVESGSRAWGCPSPDSDYDIRIIYKRTKAEYLEIVDKPDSIDYFHGELLDINGWDIKKTLRLIRKSNATPFEWAQSPIVYREVEDFSNTLLDLSKAYFHGRHAVNHYRGIAKNSYFKNNLDGSIKLKKLFYVLRPIMAARWIIEKNEVPPMDIPKLISIIADDAIVEHINELLVIKAGVNEDYIYEPDKLITDFIEKEFQFIDSIEMEDEKLDINSDLLNKKFREIIED